MAAFYAKNGGKLSPRFNLMENLTKQPNK